MNKDLERLKKEICHVGGLDLYENTLEKILVAIDQANCLISCNYLCFNSKIQQPLKGVGKAHIRIGVKGKKSLPTIFGTFYMNLDIICQEFRVEMAHVLNVK